MRFIRSRPVILGAVSLDLFAVLLGGATALLPMFAKEVLHVVAWGLGLLRAAPAAGALLGHSPVAGAAGHAGCDARARQSGQPIFVGASNQLGEFVSGVAAAPPGPVGSVVPGGAGTLVVAAPWMKLFPSLLGRERLVPG